ncbi:MarR family transcriptional regulator [Kineococcus sp. TRM81007]|uniref:MarR family winged helix-turn-helix transcriptional regulator n=1 Tax=Kineococcus sp. TRM81007 TaxID=2925831 RepID=UPI001F5A817F|nr:MarR family transcriptional regulator [Kineococcus sp. TRM81007]MCI2239561.1 MarR family transcriptional regulator [Kineococcus sp. TRM81007]
MDEQGEPAAPPRWLDADERRAWLKLAAVVTLLPAALDSQLQRDADLTLTGYMVLAMLSESSHGRLRMSEVAARTNSSAPRVSHVVRKLEERGWVRREADPADGRGQFAVLTAEGRDKIDGTAPGHVEAVRRLVFDALEDEDVAALEQLGGRVLTRLDPHSRFTASAD